MKTGVVLFNLGGPDSLQAVKPFLYNLFQDPDIFTFPGSALLRKPLAYLVASLRARKSRAYFEYMGGKSPITELTHRQAKALEGALGPESFKVVVAMRYWNPDTEKALQELQREGIRNIVLLPLYPQYSFTTTLSSVKEWERLCRKRGTTWEKEARVDDYHAHPGYLKALASRIEEATSSFEASRQKDIHLLFSAHGIPLKEIEAGDPYEKQIQSSVAGVLKALPRFYPHTLSYQSRVGPLKWLEPTTVDAIHRLAAEGVKNVIAVPISFVSDHSETLYELKKLYGELAMSLGMERYELMPALNDSPLFIEALKDVVLKSV